MDHIVNWEDLEMTEPSVLSGLRGAIILKIEKHDYDWSKPFSPATFKSWADGREKDEIDDIADDIHTLLAVEKALGVNVVKH